MTAITDFHGEYWWLSNFWPIKVYLDEVPYPSVEHAYQAAKTLNEDKRHQIRLATTAGIAKKLGRKVHVRHDWEQIKLTIMENLIKQKFTDSILKTKLLNTNNQLLIEGNHWNDTFWGICQGKGENHLGKILMKVREELRKENLSWIPRK